MDQRMMIKSYIGKVRGERATFRVFTTGDPKFLLFSVVDQYDCETGLQFPIARRDLKRDWRSKMVV